jgi:hypothetical protein
LIKELQSSLDFIGVDWASEEDAEDDETPDRRSVTLLDYACGTGLVSRVRCSLRFEQNETARSLL